MPLAHMALAFAVEHPAVTSAIIGVKSAEQLEGLLPALGLRLEPDILDRIDAIVAPGINVSARDSGWEPPALDVSARRRPR
jgi:aryl-alcohol dehydrogenase-like predicted oxidoreductase